ncbi:MAG TPA: type II toxin-antitoxin system ParD family antitoxin [candidate division Zixibacteria bacterium]|nr:type II toxin-antitoxin system ParD family antitoxin [candidate division Zixibacteria bacterium]
MPRNTSVTLGEHFENFITDKINEGRFGSKSEAVRAAMRLLEEHEQKVDALRVALIEGEESGISNRSIREIAERVKQKLKNGL